MLEILAGFLCGILSAMGFGGGSLLLLYLSWFQGMDHRRAAGVNLLFFLPCALISVIIYLRQGVIQWKETGLLMLFSLLGAIGGACLAQVIDTQILRILFGVLLLGMGFKDLLSAFLRPHKTAKSE